MIYGPISPNNSTEHPTSSRHSRWTTAGLRVVYATFVNEQKFDWGLFEGYDSLRVLTVLRKYRGQVRMLDNYIQLGETFECVFGYEGTLREIKSILAFQKVVVGDTRAAIMGLRDERHIYAF